MVATVSAVKPAPTEVRAFRFTFDVEVHGDMNCCDLTWHPLHEEPIPEMIPLQHRWSAKRWMMALAYDLAQTFESADDANLPATITGAMLRPVDISVQELPAKNVRRLSTSRKSRLKKAFDMALDEFEAQRAAWKQKRQRMKQ